MTKTKFMMYLTIVCLCVGYGLLWFSTSWLTTLSIFVIHMSINGDIGWKVPYMWSILKREFPNTIEEFDKLK